LKFQSTVVKGVTSRHGVRGKGWKGIYARRSDQFAPVKAHLFPWGNKIANLTANLNEFQASPEAQELSEALSMLVSLQSDYWAWCDCQLPIRDIYNPIPVSTV
jgi:hypothetical protein